MRSEYIKPAMITLFLPSRAVLAAVIFTASFTNIEFLIVENATICRSITKDKIVGFCIRSAQGSVRAGNNDLQTLRLAYRNPARLILCLVLFRLSEEEILGKKHLRRAAETPR